jgi:hypothetical protein
MEIEEEDTSSKPSKKAKKGKKVSKKRELVYDEYLGQLVHRRTYRSDRDGWGGEESQ